MKQKMITTILILLAVLAPVLIVPEVMTENYNILKLVILLIGGAFLLVLLLLNYKTLKIDKKDIFILIFIGLVCISTFLSSYVTKSIIGEVNRYEGLLMFIIYACIYLCSKKYFDTTNLKRVINIMFYTSMAIGILGILQMYVDCEILYPIFNRSINSTFGNSNFFGSYISIVLPITMVLYILKGSKKSFILGLIMFYNMISSGTRSAWVAFAVVVLIGIVYLIKQKNKLYVKRTIILSVCFILIFIFLFSGLGSVIKSRTKLKMDQMTEDMLAMMEDGISGKMGSRRIAIWEMTVKLMIKNPIFGCGTDNLAIGLVYDCSEEFFEFVAQKGTVVDKAHNEYLHIGATIGIPALIIYLIFIGMILIPQMRQMMKNKVALMISLIIISYLVQAFFNISTIGVAPLFWMILGLSDNEMIIKKLNEIV